MNWRHRVCCHILQGFLTIMPGDSAELGSCDSCLWWNYMLSLPLGTNTRQLTSNLGTNTQNFPSQPFQEAWTLRSTHRVNSGALKAPDGLWCWHTTVLPGLWQSGLSGTIVSPRAARSRIIAFSNTRTTLHKFLKAFLQGWFCSYCLEFIQSWKSAGEIAGPNHLKLYLSDNMGCLVKSSIHRATNGAIQSPVRAS